MDSPSGDPLGDDSPADDTSADTVDTDTTTSGANSTDGDTGNEVTGATEGGESSSGGGSESGSSTDGAAVPLTVDELSVGDLLVTEVMYDPDLCTDATCEWIEIFNAAGEDVDLEGLIVEDIAGNTGSIDVSVVLAAGAHGVLGRSDRGQFGYGAFAPIAYYSNSPAFNNSGVERVIVTDTIGTVLDQSEPWSGQGAEDDGISFKRHPDEDSWCFSTTVFEGVDRGSPGVENEAECNIPLPGGICMDIDVPRGVCTDSDEDDCTCVGCDNNDVCTVDDDCLCADCSDDAFCSAVDNCVDDGFCSPFNEGCQCVDCADHPLCV